MRIPFIVILSAAIAFFSCDNEPAPEVAYLSIPELSITTNADQGASSANLTTIWVEQNGQELGAFLPPCKVPVLSGEAQTFKFIPGINLNGTYSLRNQYEMLNTVSKTLDLAPGSTTSIAPNLLKFSYKENISLNVVEDFEDIGLSLIETPKNSVVLERTTNLNELFIIPGEANTKGGKWQIPPMNIAEYKSISTFEFPKYGANVWLELDYLTDVALTLGVFANEPLQTIQAPVVTLYPNNEWNKVYINLVSEVSAYPNAGDYHLFIGAINNSDSDTARVLFDNFKVLFE